MAKLLAAERIGANSPIDLIPGLTAGRAFSRLVQTALTWQHRHRARRALGRLDPHLLRDIGLDLQDASAEIAKPFWRL